YGAVFLGSPRSEHALHAHESPWTMLAPMGVLVGCCAAIGLVPRLLIPVLGDGVTAWAPGFGNARSQLAAPDLDWITFIGCALIAGLTAAAALLAFRLRVSDVVHGSTWGCGYVAPTPRIQYTSSSFAQMLVALFAWALWPRTRRPRPLPLFPGKELFHSEVP